MFKKLLSLVSKSDLLAKPIQFKIKGNEKYKTTFGGSLSLIIITLILLLGITLILQLINRSNPSISLSTALASELKIEFNNKFPLAFAVLDINANPIPDGKKLFDIVGYITNINVTSNTNSSVKTRLKFLNFTTCSKEYIESAYGSYSSLFLNYIPNAFFEAKTLYCLNPPDDYFIFNSFGNFPFQFLQFSFVTCNNGTSNNTCKSPEEIKKVLSNFEITIFTPDIYFDHLNFNSPGIPYMNSQTFILTSNLYQRLFIYLKPVNYLSDNGFILSDIKNYTYFQVDKVNQVVNLPGIQTFIPNTLVNFCFTIQTNVFNIYSRQYLSIPQILANLGGAFNSLMILCYIVNYYVEKSLKEIDILNICCTDTLVKNNFKKTEYFLKTDTEIDNKFKTNNFITEEKPDNSLENTNTLMKNPKLVKKKKMFEFSNKSIIFDYPEIEKLLGIRFSFFEIILPCIRTKEQHNKSDFAQKFSDQIFEIGFILGNLLESQLFNLLNSKK